jgi:hypothetical protein
MVAHFEIRATKARATPERQGRYRQRPEAGSGHDGSGRVPLPTGEKVRFSIK